MHGFRYYGLVRSVVLALGAVFLLSSCSDLAYQRFDEGTFEGTLRLIWVRPNQFVYEPDPDKPLKFTRAGGLAITPGRMRTDGGSIPRLLWSIPPYSPWGYAPGYIIHDWIFEAHQCGDDTITFEESAQILGDAIKTLMEQGCAPKNTFGAHSIYQAVKSPVARSAWESGSCQVSALADTEAVEGEVIAVISFEPSNPAALTNSQGECTF